MIFHKNNKYNLEFAAFSDKGGRDINEDSVSVYGNGENRCFVLCDGLGGHGMGDVASSLVTQVFGDVFKKNDNIKNFLDEAFVASEEVLMAEQMKRNAKRKMKTTAVSFVSDGKDAYIGHVGDSRLYVFDKNKVKFRTLDHSIPQSLVKSKQIKESEIRHHPDRNIVLRVLGIDWETPMHELMKTVSLKKCQAFLLCSDGFWELIKEDSMCACLENSETVEEWLRRMVAIVRQNGEGQDMDNFSAIAVWRK